MIKNIRRASALLACFATCHAAGAEASGISLRQSSGIDYITIEGEVEQSDVAHFQRLAVSSEKAVVVLGSPGGSLVPALEIGKIIRLKGFGTYVPNGAQCTSACALIWIAGQPRMLAPTSRVGFHASYTVDGGKQMESGLGNAMVGRYLTLLNLPEKALIFATSAAPDKMQWIDPRNGRPSGIEFELLEPDPEEEPRATGAPSVTASPIIASRDFSWEEGPWSVLSNTKRDGCFAVAEFASEDGASNTSSIAISKDRHRSGGRLSFSNERFKSVKDGEIYKLQVVFATGTVLDEGWGEHDFIGVDLKDGTKALVSNFEWDDLLDDFRSEEKIAFYRSEDLVDVFPLKGSSTAVRKLQECLGSNNTASQLTDPFR